MRYCIIKQKTEGNFGLVKSSKREFISFWRVFYRGSTYEYETYKQFVNTDKKLSMKDIYLAMSWKKGRAGGNKKFGTWDMSIENIKPNLDYINRVKFDKEQVDLDEYLTNLINLGIFKNTIRMRTFICHITRPLEWPILDKFVWFAANYIQNNDSDIFIEPTKKTHYFEYIDFFNELATVRGDISARKHVDEALMAFWSIHIKS